MKLTTEILIAIFSATTFAIGFAVRCVLERIYSNEASVIYSTHASPSRNNIAPSSRSIIGRGRFMSGDAVIKADYKPNNIFTTRRTLNPFALQIPKCADQAEQGVVKCFYRLVFNMLTAR